jgi:Xaa-Pro aminopeptidase
VLKSVVNPEHLARRKKLMGLDPEACFIFFGAREQARNFDTHYPFTQESNFRYLTDFDEPDAALVLVGGKSHLFVLDRDESREIWNGERYGTERARLVFQVDEAQSVEQLYSKLEELIVDAKRVYYTLGKDSARDQKVLSLLHSAKRFQGQGRFGHLPVFDPTPLLAELRVVKDETEIGFLRKASSATAKAHIQLLKRLKAGMTEFEAANEFQYHVFKNGCDALGYTPIFASGLNATTLHYIKNNDTLKHGDLFLIDAAGELNGYTSDLTQTFPISGTFSDAQKLIYEKVLEVNREITRLAKPGTTYRALHARSVEMLTETLLSLGVLEGDLQANIKSMTYRKFYPHGLGHYLGLDVHDTGIYRERGKDFELKVGMLITNEPGLYFRERGNPYYGIGVRIEDDLLITESGSEVLTHELPRDVNQIETLRTIATT